MSTAHLAISHWMPWKSAMVLPKAARCWTYSVAYMRAPSARPMPRAATIGRMALSPSMARRKPPTSPMTFSAGTWTSVSSSSPVSTPLTPILWSVRPTSTPSHARSTMKAVMESWARLVGLARLGEDGVPVRLAHPRHPALGAVEDPAARRSLVGHGPGPHAHDVAAGLGLGQAEGGPQGAVADPGQVARLLGLGPGDHHRSGGQAGQQQHEGGRVGVLGHLLDGQGQAEDPGPRAPVRLGNAQPEQAGVAEGLEDVGRVGALFVDGPGPRLHLVLGQAPHRIAELEQLVGEVELHRCRLSELPARYFLALEPRRPREPRDARLFRADRADRGATAGTPDLRHPRARRRRHHDRAPEVAGRPPGRVAQVEEEGPQAQAPLAAAHPLRVRRAHRPDRGRGRRDLRLRQLPLRPDQEGALQAPGGPAGRPAEALQPAAGRIRLTRLRRQLHPGPRLR